MHIVLTFTPEEIVVRTNLADMSLFHKLLLSKLEVRKFLKVDLGNR